MESGTLFAPGPLLSTLTTMRVGGAARFLEVARSEGEISSLVKRAEAAGVAWRVIGEGSNLVPSDAGFDGLIIKNEVQALHARDTLVFAGAGNNLHETIESLGRLGLAGLETMAGIPGTVGGAIYGCAGAYGREIRDVLVRARVFDGHGFEWLPAAECGFDYRHSKFKKLPEWVIVGAELRLAPGSPDHLAATASETVTLRHRKYPPGMLCAGSFFKNLLTGRIPPDVGPRLLPRLDPAKIVAGKIPAGYLVELAGGRGLRRGGVEVSPAHGNLLVNLGSGTATDVRVLAFVVRERVKSRFGIDLEEEVQYLETPKQLTPASGGVSP